jgi:hypothetical protein
VPGVRVPAVTPTEKTVTDPEARFTATARLSFGVKATAEPWLGRGSWGPVLPPVEEPELALPLPPVVVPAPALVPDELLPALVEEPELELLEAPEVELPAVELEAALLEPPEALPALPEGPLPEVPEEV